MYYTGVFFITLDNIANRQENNLLFEETKNGGKRGLFSGKALAIGKARVPPFTRYGGLSANPFTIG
jgi:hypothetical protein